MLDRDRGLYKFTKYLKQVTSVFKCCTQFLMCERKLLPKVKTQKKRLYSLGCNYYHYNCTIIIISVIMSKDTLILEQFMRDWCINKITEMILRSWTS